MNQYFECYVELLNWILFSLTLSIDLRYIKVANNYSGFTLIFLRISVSVL